MSTEIVSAILCQLVVCLCCCDARLRSRLLCTGRRAPSDSQSADDTGAAVPSAARVWCSAARPKELAPEAEPTTATISRLAVGLVWLLADCAACVRRCTCLHDTARLETGPTEQDVNVPPNNKKKSGQPPGVMVPMIKANKQSTEHRHGRNASDSSAHCN